MLRTYYKYHPIGLPIFSFLFFTCAGQTRIEKHNPTFDPSRSEEYPQDDSPNEDAGTQILEIERQNNFAAQNEDDTEIEADKKNALEDGSLDTKTNTLLYPIRPLMWLPNALRDRRVHIHVFENIIDYILDHFHQFSINSLAYCNDNIHLHYN